MDASADFARAGYGSVLFAENFDFPNAAAAPEPEVIEPSFSAAELAAARADGFEAGRAAAAAEAASADHARLRQTVQAMGEQLAVMQQEVAALAEESAANLARVLLSSLGAVLPQLAARYGEAELQALIHHLVPGLFREPAVTLRVNPCHAAALAQEVEALDPDLAARLEIRACDAMPPGDLRVAWRNGGATRDAAAIWAAVTDVLGLTELAPQPAQKEQVDAG